MSWLGRISACGEMTKKIVSVEWRGAGARFYELVGKDFSLRRNVKWVRDLREG